MVVILGAIGFASLSFNLGRQGAWIVAVSVTLVHIVGELTFKPQILNGFDFDETGMVSRVAYLIIGVEQYGSQRSVDLLSGIIERVIVIPLV